MEEAFPAEYVDIEPGFGWFRATVTPGELAVPYSVPLE